MVISPDILRREMVQLLTSIDEQIKEVQTEAEKLGIPAMRLRDDRGNWVMIPLLSAKIQAISSLIELNKRGRARD